MSTAGKPSADGAAPRAYRSALRQSRAVETKERICRVAAPLFAEQGYARTSVRQIAGAAGVALETVYSLGDKREVFLNAFELTLRGTLKGTPLLDLDEVRPATHAETLDDFVKIVVGFVVSSNRNTAPLWRAFVEAANSDDVLAGAYDEYMNKMRQQGRKVLVFAVRAGLCPPPVNTARTLDEIWATLHPSQYDLLVRHAGWGERRYRQWLIARVVSIVTS